MNNSSYNSSYNSSHTYNSLRNSCKDAVTYNDVLPNKALKLIQHEIYKLKFNTLPKPCIQGKHFTIIMHGGKILACETNCNLGKPTNYITRRVNTTTDYYTRHSEIQALHRMRKTIIKKRKMNSLLVINFKIGHDLSIKNSCCCKACTETLIRLGVTKVIYSLDDGSFVKKNLDDLKEIAKPSKGTVYKNVYM